MRLQQIYLASHLFAYFAERVSSSSVSIRSMNSREVSCIKYLCTNAYFVVWSVAAKVLLQTNICRISLNYQRTCSACQECGIEGGSHICAPSGNKSH